MKKMLKIDSQRWFTCHELTFSCSYKFVKCNNVKKSQDLSKGRLWTRWTRGSARSSLDVLLVTVRGKSSHCEPTWRHRLHHCHAAFHFNFPLAINCAIHCTSDQTGCTSVHSFQGFKIHSNLPSVTLTEVGCQFTGVCRANISWVLGPFKDFSNIQCITFKEA